MVTEPVSSNSNDNQDHSAGDESSSNSKRKYSRNGCTECKKRRMKCDETKPKCWQCNRLNRECVYILNRKNKKRRSKNDPAPPPSVKKSRNHQIKPEFPGLSNQLITQLDDPLNGEFNFTLSDANLLYNDLNEIVNFRLEEALTTNLKTYIQESSTPFNPDFEFHTLPLTANNETIIHHPLSSFDLGDPHNEYLKRFYYGFCKLLCPFVPNLNQNPVRDVLLQYAKRESYLMYAVLACGAKVAHHDSLGIQDDQAYCSYLSSCLNILSENFTEDDDGDDDSLSGNVEAMLLTILLLTSDCASSKNLRWRAHLKGAKELLKKTTIQSDILSFCRNWLIAYELLAGIANPFGGIFQQNDTELEEFVTNDETYLTSLKRLNMLDIHGFNYFDGHIIDLDLIFKDIVNILNSIRKFKALGLKKSHLDHTVEPKVVSLDTVTGLLIRLNQIQQISIIDSSGIVPESNPNHYIHNKIEKGFDCIDKLKIDNHTFITVSWFDISHQAHIIAAKVTLLVKVLEMPKTSILVQELVQKGLSFVKFLDYMPDYENPCMTHLHIMMDTLGRCMINEEDQRLARQFLQILHGMGLASAGHNLKKLERIWSQDTALSEEEEDVLTW